MALISSSMSPLTTLKLRSGAIFLVVGITSAQLSSSFYATTCPSALATINNAVNTAVSNEARMGASLLRLHFHDFFVNGCDASILLDDTANLTGEKIAARNLNSVRDFDVIDTIKTQLESSCPGVVSCADIVAAAARDSVVALGGPTWELQLGRRDSTQANKTLANVDLPSPFMDLPEFIESFRRQGLDSKDLVVLSSAHTIGLAQCFTFRGRIYNASSDKINPGFAAQHRKTCPANGGNSILSPLDPTLGDFDGAYYSELVQKRGLVASDPALFGSGSNIADELRE